MYQVLLTDRAWPSLDIETEVLAAAGARLIEAPAGDEKNTLRTGSRGRRDCHQLGQGDASSDSGCTQVENCGTSGNRTG